MKALALACTLLLAGCLEVEQHPPWRHGEYDGKPDNLQHQQFFHNDKLAWTATIHNRNWLQDEYPRTFHQGVVYD
jgi:hypothetical protein